MKVEFYRKEKNFFNMQLFQMPMLRTKISACLFCYILHDRKKKYL